MGYIIMAYASGGYEEYILPDINDANYEIVLGKNTFSLNEDFKVSLEIVDGKWRFTSQKEYQLLKNGGESAFNDVLTDGMVLELLTGSRKITLVVLSCLSVFPMFHKYRLDYVNQVTVGKEQNNTIVYDFRGFISRNHVVIFKHENRWIVQDNSSNGTYLNGRRVREQAYLKFGDQITIFGLRIIFLIDLLAVCSLSGNYEISDSSFMEYLPREYLGELDGEIITEKKVFFKRAPRTVEEVYRDDIEIEGPPPLNKAKKRPLLLTIGPSFTMAIPMMLGCAMSILSAKNSGATSSISMFTSVSALASSILRFTN